jgi:hypothetical protein
MVLYLCVFIVFSLHSESLKLILVDEPLAVVVLSQLYQSKLEVTHLSHLIFWLKPDAHRMYAQDQVVTYGQNVNTENQCLYYINIITQDIVFILKM